MSLWNANGNSMEKIKTENGMQTATPWKKLKLKMDSNAMPFMRLAP